MSIIIPFSSKDPERIKSFKWVLEYLKCELGARDAVPSWAGREDDAFVVQRITEARAAIREGREFWATYRAAHPT